MAEFSTDLFRKQDPARSNTSRMPARNSASGNLQIAQIVYTCDGTETNGDTINLCILPAGVTVLGAQSSILVLSGSFEATLLIGQLGETAIGTAALDQTGAGRFSTIGTGRNTLESTAAERAAFDTTEKDVVLIATWDEVQAAQLGSELHFTIAYLLP
jgi:hypothetical protein